MSGAIGTAGAKTGRIVVAGGSLAGHSAVSELVALDYPGEILWITGETGGVYSKPALSKEFMQGRAAIDEIMLPPVADGHPRLTIRDGTTCTALRPDERVIEMGGADWLGFDGLVLCTGASARMPAMAAGVPGVLPLRTLADAMAIRSALADARQVLILGGGLIGCELAASLRTLGRDVTLVEMQPTLLARPFGPFMGEYFLDLHRRHGVRVLTGKTIETLVICENRVAGARLGDGETIAADLVLVGAGSEPATGWLEGSGLALANGIVCDARLATSHAGIYAAGDAARWFNPAYEVAMRVEHWTNASAQGRAAARNLFHTLAGQPERTMPFIDIPYFWSDQFGLKIQMVGWHEGHDRVEVQNEPGSAGPLVTFFKGERLVAAAGVNASRKVMGYRRQIADGADFHRLAAAAS